MKQQQAKGAPRFMGRWLVLLAWALMALALGGCAAQQAFREAETLKAKGEDAAALSKYRKAWQAQPGSSEYRLGYLMHRDRLLATRLEAAEQVRTSGDLQQAESRYRQILAIDATHARAAQGLQLIERQRRLARWLAEAEALVQRKQWSAAQEKLRAMLIELPGHEQARQLLQRIEPELQAAQPEAQLAAIYQKPVTLEFREAPLRALFDALSRSSGLNFVFDKDIKLEQRASIFLRNTPLEAALNVLLSTQQLEQRVLNANSLLIYPATPAKQKEYQPLRVRSYYLAHADAKAVAASLRSLARLREVVVDEKLNLVIARDSADALRMADRIVALHDLPEGEVMLEVEILEVKRSRLIDLGVRWPEQVSFSPLSTGSGSTLTLDDLRNLDSSRIGVGVGNLSIAANRTDSDANILANPRIRTRNREKAKILIGERVPNITSTATATGFVSESISYVDVGLKLDVEPTVHVDGEVAIRIALEVSNIINQVQTKAGSLAYQIGTRSAQTMLRLRDGENQILAGLISDEERDSAAKIPLLGDIPLAGRLFGRHSDGNTKTEIVLSITPRIVRGAQRPPAELLDFESGTDASFALRPVSAAAPVGATGAVLPPARLHESGGRIGQPAATISTGGANTSAPGMAPQQDPSAGAAAIPLAPRLFWQGPDSLHKDEEIELTLMLQTDTPLSSLPMSFSVDPKLIRVLRLQEGSLLRQDGTPTQFESRLDDSGRTVVSLTRTSGGARGIGPLFTVRLKALAAGPLQTLLRSEGGALTGPSGFAQSPAEWPSWTLRIQP